jgi:Ca-activated chloride channel homolog
VLGRYEAAPTGASGELAVTGTRAGREERFAARVDFPARAASGDYIPRLWASRKVGELMRTIRVEGSTPARVAEVRDLALRYGLVTEYTSHLVQEPQIAGRVGGGIVPTAGAAAAPVVVTGETAVMQAQLAATRRQARNVADVAAAERVAADQLARVANGGERIVGGRRFLLASEIWTDVAHAASARVVHVTPFTRAYFDLLATLPELKAYVTAFDAVIVAGGAVSIHIGPGGSSTLTEAQLKTMATEFRTRER